MPLILEKDVERKLGKRVESVGGQCIKFISPGESGVPDRLVVLPRGKIIFVELKRPSGGRLSAVQKYQIARLRKLGCNVEVIRNFEEIELMLRKYSSGGYDVGGDYDRVPSEELSDRRV